MKKILPFFFLLVFLCSCGNKPTELEYPHKIELNGYVLEWNNVKYANSYAVFINNKGFQSNVNKLVIDESFYGSYVDVQIMAKSNDLEIADSVLSDVKTFFVAGNKSEADIRRSLNVIMDSNSVEKIIISARNNRIGFDKLDRLINAFLNSETIDPSQFIDLCLDNRDEGSRRFIIEAIAIICDSNINSYFPYDPQLIKDFINNNKENLLIGTKTMIDVISIIQNEEFINSILSFSTINKLNEKEIKALVQSFKSIINDIRPSEKEITNLSNLVSLYISIFLGYDTKELDTNLHDFILSFIRLFDLTLDKIEHDFLNIPFPNSNDQNENLGEYNYQLFLFIHSLTKNEEIDEALSTINFSMYEMLKIEGLNDFIVTGIYNYFSNQDVNINQMIDYNSLIAATLTGNYNVFKKSLDNVANLSLLDDSSFFISLAKYANQYNEEEKQKCLIEILLPGFLEIYDNTFLIFGDDDYELMINFYGNIANSLMEIIEENIITKRIERAKDISGEIFEAAKKYLSDKNKSSVNIKTLVEENYLLQDYGLDITISRIVSLFKITYKIDGFRLNNIDVSYNKDTDRFSFNPVKSSFDYSEIIETKRDIYIAYLKKSIAEISEIYHFDHNILKGLSTEEIKEYLINKFNTEFPYFEEGRDIFTEFIW